MATAESVYSVPVFTTALILLNEPQLAEYAARYTLYPEMPDELLGFQDRFTECVPAAVPFPESACVVVDGCALLVKVSVALALPGT